MDIAQAIERYHSACDAFAMGDPAPIKALYARSEDVLLAIPFGGTSRGWTAVSQALDFVSSNFRDGKRVRFEEVSRFSSADEIIPVAVGGVIMLPLAPWVIRALAGADRAAALWGLSPTRNAALRDRLGTRQALHSLHRLAGADVTPAVLR
jgi:hypothetical protein